MARATIVCAILFSGTLVACGPPGGGPQAAGFRSAPALPNTLSTPAAAAQAGAAAFVGDPASHPVRLPVQASVPAPPDRPARAGIEPLSSADLEQEARSRELLDTIRTHADPAVRRAAIDRWTDEPRPLAPLIEVVFADKDPLVRRWAALAIGRKATRAEQPALRQASRSEPDPAVRRILEQAAAR